MKNNLPSEARPSTPPVSRASLPVLVSSTAEQAKQSMASLGLIQAVQVQGAEGTIQARLEGLTMAEKAVMVVDMLTLSEKKAEVIGLIVDHLWNIYVVPERLWEHYDGGEDKFKEDVSFTDFIQPTLASAAQTRLRKKHELSVLEKEWGVGWEKIIEPENHHVSALSQHYLREMGRLARNKISVLDARTLLHQVRETRHSNPRRGVGKEPLVTAGDIRNLNAAIEMFSASRKIKPQECTTVDLLLFLQAATPPTVTGRITEIQSPVATQTPPPPNVLLASDIRSLTDQATTAATGQIVSQIDRSLIEGGIATSPDTSHTAVQAGMHLQLARRPPPTEQRSTDERLGMHDPPAPVTTQFGSQDSILNTVTGPSPPTGDPPISDPLGSHDPVPPSPPPCQSSPATVRQSISTVLGAGPSDSHPGTVALSFVEHESGVWPYSGEISGRTHFRSGTAAQGVLPVGSQYSLPEHSGLPASQPNNPASPPVSQTSSAVLRVTSSGSPTGTGARGTTAGFGPGPSEKSASPLSAVSGATTSHTSRKKSHKKRRVSSTGRPLKRSVRRSSHTAPEATPQCSGLEMPAESPVDSERDIWSHSPLVSRVRQSRAGTTSPPQSQRAGSRHTAPRASEGPADTPGSRKRTHSETSLEREPVEVHAPPFFTLDKDWIINAPVSKAIQEQGFYICPEILTFPSVESAKAIFRDLQTYVVHDKPEADGLHLTNCLHSLFHQFLVQNPHAYLTALAAMKTENHRLISLPVPPLVFPDTHDSPLADPGFPYAEFIANEREVPATRLLFSSYGCKMRIPQTLHSKADVKEWWEKCSGDLEVAATQLPLKEFAKAEVAHGQFIAFPPQKPFYLESKPGAESGVQIIHEIRYIPVSYDKELDFAYSPQLEYEMISRWNRELVGPQITGWGALSADYQFCEERYPSAIELRGVWHIGDALLGLTSWNSPLVQLELEELFTADEGEWFNHEFVHEVMIAWMRKLKAMAEFIELVYLQTFAGVI